MFDITLCNKFATNYDSLHHLQDSLHQVSSHLQESVPGAKKSSARCERKDNSEDRSAWQMPPWPNHIILHYVMLCYITVLESIYIYIYIYIYTYTHTHVII